MRREKHVSLAEKEKIHSLLFYRRKVFANSTCSRVLNLLYPESQLTIKEMTSKIRKPYLYSKKIVMQMNHDGYLTHDSKSYNREYKLSQMGRWFAICGELDNIPFQSLCILSKVYVNEKKYHKRYMVSMYRRNFDESCDDLYSIPSAIYSSRNISRSIKMLTDRFLVYRISEGNLKTMPKVLENLENNYDSDLNSLFSWSDEMLTSCMEIRFENIKLDNAKKNLFGLVS